MGGIIGKLSFDADEPLARAVLEQMLDTVARRSRAEPADGHGARGLHLAPGIALGWCSDADEVAPAAASAGTAHRAIRVVADARLTNAPELRRWLGREHDVFIEGSDAELIAHAYARWGTRCLDRLRGPFAFALWDERHRRLLMARDHLGVRPLHFALLHGHGVVFATDLRALFCDPGVGREWCATGIDAYLALGHVPAPLTAFRRVSKLEPAQFLVVEGRRLHVEQYWDLPPAAARMADAVSGVEHHLRSAVRGQLHLGVDGVLYSGGVASSALLAAVAPGAATAVTVALDEDVPEVARAVEAGTALGHRPELEVAAPAAPVAAGDIVAQFDEPIGDPSAVAQLATCVAARRYSGCALTAHGAATLWAGSVDPRAQGLNAACVWDGELRRRLYTRAFAWQVRDANPFARHRELGDARGADAIDRAAYVAARTFLPDNLLTVAQRSAQAAGLRLRFPFLDREFAEFAATVPTAAKQQGGTGMLALRELLARRLPPALMPAAHRRPAVPSWLHGAVAAMVPAVLLAPRFDGRGIVSRPALTTLWEEHLGGRRDHAHRLWSLLMLEFWFRTYIDGDVIEQPVECALLKAA